MAFIEESLSVTISDMTKPTCFALVKMSLNMSAAVWKAKHIADTIILRE